MWNSTSINGVTEQGETETNENKDKIQVIVTSITNNKLKNIWVTINTLNEIKYIKR